MRRKIYSDLQEWKKNSSKKPLLLQGARQVGKTYIISQFGKNEYTHFIYLNFEQDKTLKTFFEGSLNPISIIENISLYLGHKIESKDSLIFFDEIQEVPNAITSLKYFYEQNPEFHIIAAGSLLGVSVGKEHSFPVGKVNFLSMFPLSFSEFLAAAGEVSLHNLINEGFLRKLAEPIHEKLNNLFKRYLYLGGMPEVLAHYFEHKDIEAARNIQDELLKSYERDFSKYTDKNQAIKTSDVWNSIPYQLSKESKKFKYSDVRKKARAAHYAQTIEWLKSAGLIYVVYNVNTPKIPISGYADRSKFKIYLFDTGLMGALLKLPSSIIVTPDKLFEDYNGAFIENYTAIEFNANNINELFYWTSKSDAEVDFVIQDKDRIIPIEIKSGTSLNTKSIRSYANKYSPKSIIRSSPRNYEQRDNFYNLPLYWISRVLEL
ncbi:MAG: ATPase [Bacteroidetes bacterium]|nr:MAG: ATPase [Bacteroidota bacterium]